MIIDAHNHPDWHRHNLGASSNMKQYNIDKTWLLSWVLKRVGSDIPCLRCGGDHSLFRCLSYAEQRRERFILGYTDPRKPDSIEAC